MKKMFLAIAMVATSLTTFAQATLSADGSYESKIVENYESMSAQDIYVNALEVLSDWTGSQKNSSIDIDIQDKETGLIVFKGQYFLGFHKTNGMCGYNVFADFTVKIRCKDGRAQFSCNVPTITFKWSATNNPATETAPLNMLYPEYTYKSKLYYIKKASNEFVPTVPDVFNDILNMLATKTHITEDDF